MIEQPDSSLEKSTKKLFQININLDKTKNKLSLIVNRIKSKYEPRTEFIKWRDSQEGKNWKKQQYKKQKENCAMCNQRIELKGSHIDHIKPLAKYPNLSLDISNLRITCWQCNTNKSDR